MPEPAKNSPSNRPIEPSNPITESHTHKKPLPKETFLNRLVTIIVDVFSSFGYWLISPFAETSISKRTIEEAKDELQSTKESFSKEDAAPKAVSPKLTPSEIRAQKQANAKNTKIAYCKTSEYLNQIHAQLASSLKDKDDVEQNDELYKNMQHHKLGKGDTNAQIFYLDKLQSYADFLKTIAAKNPQHLSIVHLWGIINVYKTELNEHGQLKELKSELPEQQQQSLDYFNQTLIEIYHNYKPAVYK